MPRPRRNPVLKMSVQPQTEAGGVASQETARSHKPCGGSADFISDVSYNTRRLVLATGPLESSRRRPSLTEAQPANTAHKTTAGPAGAKARRKETERFRRRRLGLLRKAEQLRADFGVQAYVVIHRSDRYFTYTSLPNQPDWPPPPMVLVSSRPSVPIRSDPSDPAAGHALPADSRDDA
jgi:hypothetical protein